MIETAYPHEIPKLTAEEQKDLCTITDLLAKHKNKNFRDAIAHDMYMYNDLDAMIIGALKAVIFDSYQYNEQMAQEINDLAYECANHTLTEYTYYDLLEISKKDWTK